MKELNVCVNVVSMLNVDVLSAGAVLPSLGKVGLFLSGEGCSQLKGEKHMGSRRHF